MEETRVQDAENQSAEQQTASVYQPRPTWQRVAAWIGFAIVTIGVILYYYQIARGGL